MRTNLFFYVTVFLLPLCVFGHFGNASLQIDFENRRQYLVQIGNEEFLTNDGTITFENLNSGFYPVHIYQLNIRTKRLLYKGGVNLAAGSITYTQFFRGNLEVTEVVALYEPSGVVMSDVDFNRFLYSIADESFDSSRLEMMEIQLNYQFFTAHQIAQVLNEFSFESNKLAIAKLAFGKTVDPHNYYLVSEEFSFSSSKRELKEFILNQ
ncbi:DUF4476 domain-containing protein [Moheibacter lacus]|uniref:DUF4476 domain-containing protein n=1 Tax=Moheibacter lacus TaxID=2745851 RepID=A0A838ZU71_9FLAO|nr:DUF4476 domain-containing protein [Moheibacter lacus]MBA5630513.1 DUF4476 domain-containing protein [Moheibacter lacus]